MNCGEIKASNKESVSQRQRSSALLLCTAGVSTGIGMCAHTVDLTSRHVATCVLCQITCWAAGCAAPAAAAI